MKKHVAVLMGGWSAEREVSLVSGRECSAALKQAGYAVSEIDVGRDIAEVLSRVKPDVCFNALHGRVGEDGCIQGLLEILGIPYTHSGVLASALAMDKPAAKRQFAGAGIACAEGRVVDRDEVLRGHPMPPPYVVKPVNEGSSVGVTIVSDGGLPRFHNEGWRYGSKVLVERYIPGRELTCGVMGDRPLAVTEMRPHEGFYDYAAKYIAGKTDHLVPAPLPPAVYDNVMRTAVLAHQTLGCRGVSRADFRYDDTRDGRGKLYLLEVNTQPGMTPLSLVPEQAAHVGIPFVELVDWMVEHAQCDA
ncbi:MAG: D-alanine--D-alanine ligase [Alphaproteobacteria bacterium]|nr:D-alanine--D-alanine ligase [Alphaproteobacteria bacterium]